MEKCDLEKALAAGQNVVLVNGKVMLLQGVTDRPANCVDIANLDSGKQYICKPEQVADVVGTVDTDALPWKAGKDDAKASGMPANCLSWSFTTPKGDVIEPNTTVNLAGGGTAVYLGRNLKAQKYPLFIRLDGGKVIRCTAGYIMGKAA